MENRLSEQEISDLQNKFLHKRISVEGGDGQVWIGKCKFLGYNKYLPSWDLQITIDRTPISNVKLSSIKLME